MAILCFAIALFACVIGKTCGMGGGVIIKPVLDAAGVMSVSTINFLSGCTVWGMSVWSVGKSLIKKEKDIDLKISTPLAIGAAIGGIIGKELFSLASKAIGSSDRAGGIQAALLVVATIAVLIYTVKKDRVKSFNVAKWYVCVIIGFLLGTFGSFLGIGGGPFNMAVLYLFFSMTTKIASQNSLYLITFSQLAGLLKTIISGNVPEVSVGILIGMVAFGVLGSEIGGRVSKRISEKKNTALFEYALVLVILISAYNMRLLFK